MPAIRSLSAMVPLESRPVLRVPDYSMLRLCRERWWHGPSNAIGSARMASAHTDPGKIGLPIAGDDKKAIEVTSQLAREVGLRNRS